MSYQKTDRSRVRQVAKRGHYDEATVHAIFDDAFVAQVAFQVEGQPYQIPMLYAREGHTIYLHGSPKSRIYQQLSTGLACCLGVTHVDGLVIARSAFHHSVNYRSVVAYGKCRPVEEVEEKLRVFALFTNTIVPGRWEECRPMTEKEARVTGILAFEIEEASAKIRTGGPVDDAEDYALPIWAGVIPIEKRFGQWEADPAMKEPNPVPASIKKLLDQ